MRQEEISKYLNNREDIKQDKPLVSDPVDSDFKDFILYVSLKNKNFDSFEVLDMLSKHSDFKLRTHIQDVDALSSKPSWMVKLPALVIKKERKAFLAEECKKYILENSSHLVQQRRSNKSSRIGHATSKDTWNANF